jgi:hypothetical protein
MRGYGVWLGATYLLGVSQRRCEKMIHVHR